MKFKNIEIGSMVEYKNPENNTKYYVTVTDLNKENKSFSGVIVYAEDNASYELGAFTEGLHPKYFKPVSTY